MTMARSETIPADYRQLIAQFKNLAFVEAGSCAIVSVSATVPSSSTADFDKTCYPSPKGRFIGKPEKPPLFLLGNRHGRSIAHGRCRRLRAAFRPFNVPIESPAIRGFSRRDNQKCEPPIKLSSQVSWPLVFLPVCRRTLNVRVLAPRSVLARQSFWIPTRSLVPLSARPPVRSATTLPTCAEARICGGALWVPLRLGRMPGGAPAAGHVDRLRLFFSADDARIAGNGTAPDRLSGWGTRAIPGLKQNTFVKRVIFPFGPAMPIGAAAGGCADGAPRKATVLLRSDTSRYGCVPEGPAHRWDLPAGRQAGSLPSLRPHHPARLQRRNFKMTYNHGENRELNAEGKQS